VFLFYNSTIFQPNLFSLLRFYVQVHDSLNHLQKASEILNLIQQSQMPHTPQGLVCSLDEILKHLMKCQSRLILPCQLTLQAIIASGFAVYS